MKRLGEIVPKLHAALEKMSAKNYQQAYYSPARDTLGYFIRTELAAAQVRARLKDGPSFGTEAKAPILAPQDKVLVVEIGTEYDAREYKGKIDPWLRNH